MAARLRIDLDESFAVFRPAPAPCPTNGWGVSEWLDALRGSTTTAELARRVGRSRFSVGRWLSGETVPRVPDFLRLLDAATGRLADWVAALVPIESVPALEPIFRRAAAARRLSSDRPWSEAVLRVMETAAYSARQHSAAFIAETLRVDEDLVEEVVATLEAGGLIERVGNTYRVRGTLVVDTHAGPDALKRLRQHWADVARERLESNEESWFAYNVISVSKADCERIEQRLRGVFREIRGIVKESEPTEQAALLTIQLVRWSPP